MFQTSSLSKRILPSTAGPGATAGLSIGIAVSAILLILILTFFTIHLLRLRRTHRLAALDTERAILAGEKNPDGTHKHDKFAPYGNPRDEMAQTATEPKPADSAPTIKRNKSVRDRLMGPLYRGSIIELQAPPRARLAGPNADANNSHSLTGQDKDLEWINKPWATSNSPRPSFSSKRATRLMMVM